MRHLAPIAEEQQEPSARRQGQRLEDPSLFSLAAGADGSPRHARHGQRRQRRVRLALRAQIGQRVDDVPLQRHRRAAVVKQVLNKIHPHAVRKRAAAEQPEGCQRHRERKARSHRHQHQKRLPETPSPPDAEQRKEPQPEEQAAVRILDEKDERRGSAEGNSPAHSLFLLRFHEPERRQNAQRQRRKAEFLRAPSLRKRPAYARSRRQQGNQRKTPKRRFARLPVCQREGHAERHHQRGRLQRKNAEEAVLGEPCSRRIDQIEQRALVVKQIPVGHEPAQHAPPDGKVNIRIRPEICRIQRRAGGSKQQRQKRGAKRAQPCRRAQRAGTSFAGASPLPSLHSLFLLYR